MTEPTPVKPIIVNNSFKSTSIHGAFKNMDYADGTILADGYFQRNLKVDGTLNITNLTLNEIDPSGNVIINTSGVAMKSYVNTQINSLIGGQPSSFYDTLTEISRYIETDVNLTTTLTNSIAGKQSELTSTSIIPNLTIQGAFPTRSAANTVLFLNNGSTSEGIKFMVNAAGGVMNSNISNDDSVIYAFSTSTNKAALVLTTSSNNSLAYIRINVNNIWLGGSNTNINNICTAINNTASFAITTTCSNINYSSLPKCAGVPILNNELVNKLYVDNKISAIDLSPYLISSNLNDYALKSYVNSQISAIDLSDYALKSYVTSQISAIDLSAYLISSNLNDYALKSYVNSQISAIDLTGYVTSTALTNKQDTLTSTSIIPSLSIKQAFIGNSGLNNNILQLENTSTGNGINFVINSNNQSGVLYQNANIDFNDSLIYAKSNAINGANLILTTFSNNVPSTASIRLTFNQIFQRAFRVNLEASNSLFITCPNTTFSSLPTCATLATSNNQFTNKNYVDTQIGNIDLTPYLTLSALTSYTTTEYVDGKINDLLGGQPSEFYDTLKEISDYIESDMNCCESMATAISSKQNLIIEDSIIPNITIQGNFPTRSPNNTVLFLKNEVTNYGIKFLVNASAGAVNSYVSNNDSVIYAFSEITNAANLVLTTSSNNSKAYIKINVNNVFMGGDNSAVTIDTKYVMLKAGSYISFTSSDIRFSSLPTCDVSTSSNPNELINTTIANSLYTQLSGSNDITATNNYSGYNEFRLILPTTDITTLSYANDIYSFINRGIANQYYTQLSANNTYTGENEYSVLPTCSIVPTSNSQLVNKLYIDTQLSSYLTTASLYTYLVSGSLSNTVINDTLYMGAPKAKYIRATATSMTIYSDNILVLAGGSNTIIRASGVENLYMNNTGIPYCFSLNAPSHESHIITKKYLEQETTNTKAYVDSETVITKQYVDNETNKCVKFTDSSNGGGQRQISMYGGDNYFTIDTINGNGFRFYNKSPSSAGFIFYPSSNLSKKFEIKSDTGIYNSGANNFSGITTFTATPKITSSIINNTDVCTKGYADTVVNSLADDVNTKITTAQADINYGGKYTKLPVFVARDIGYQYQTTTLLATSMTTTETKKIIEITNVNCGVFMVETTVFFKASAANHGFYIEIRQPRYFTTQKISNIPSLPGIQDPSLPNLPPVQLVPNIPNYPLNSGSGNVTAGIINIEYANASGVFQVSSAKSSLMVICKTSLMISSPINGADFEVYATSSNGGTIACGSMTVTRIA